MENFPAVERVRESASFAADLLSYALDAVDWHELAQSFVTDELDCDPVPAAAELDRRRPAYLDALRRRVASGAKPSPGPIG